MSCQAAPRRHASATAKSTAKSGGGWGLTGDKNSFYFNNLLIPKVTPPSSNPSLSAKFPNKINAKKFAGGILVANRRYGCCRDIEAPPNIQQLARPFAIAS